MNRRAFLNRTALAAMTSCIIPRTLFAAGTAAGATEVSWQWLTHSAVTGDANPK